MSSGNFLYFLDALSVSPNDLADESPVAGYFPRRPYFGQSVFKEPQSVRDVLLGTFGVESRDRRSSSASLHAVDDPDGRAALGIQEGDVLAPETDDMCNLRCRRFN